ncbi:efflux RND transporter permease subunit [Oleiagrimonas sp.]|jgi:Cu(I)/Ag(I) efflux system membrane protein CusA/SilA|uniref:efflux RND transporter permease subunit n=1 Tax=Oleiagrimonas sp. TaxID=2010330 RepID=UPI002620C669|nr:efflux RND transporter permease subunit [Oleiagrimonas sp.]MDA3914577.1 efflux RND transporter permease subunit [Oleiagrimonas sp.]
MIASIIRWSLRNRGAVLLALALVVFAGLYSIQHTPVDAIPDLSDVQVIIKTPYPGQAPQVVQDQVTYPLETAMLAVPGATVVRGYSFFGASFVYIIFKDGTDLYWARSRVLEYLNQVASSLPTDAHPSLGPDATGVGWVYQYALVDKTGKHNLAQLTSLQDWFLKYQLQTVPGVAEVATVGGMVKQYQVVVNPDKLRAYGITLAHVRMAIKNANHETGGAVVELAEAEYMVRASGYIKSIKDLLQVPLMTDKNGTPVQLKDVAEVRMGPQIRRGVSELDGQGEAVGGVIVMRYGGNAQKTIDGVKARLASLKGSLPPGVQVVTTYDRSQLISDAIGNLREKLIEEFLVVALICGVFLFHFRSSLVAIISLPVGILMAFIVMRLQGLTANIMSLGGIAIAIGAMVDGAIVMIENLHKHMEKEGGTDKAGHWRRVATATVEVGPALFFSLVIITLSVVPILSLTGQAGRMFSPLAYTWIYSMGAAAIMAVTLVPVLMGYFIRGKITPEHRNPLNRALTALYTPVIKRVVRYPWVLLFVGILIVVAGAWPASHLGSEFMPPLDEGDLLYMPSARPGISADKARQVLQQTDKLIMSVPEVQSVFGKMGRADTATDPAPLSMDESIIQFKPKSQWRAGITKADIVKELEQRVRYPGFTNAWVMPIKTRIDMLSTGIKTPVGIKVSGPDLQVIQRIGKELEQLLPQVRGTTSVYAERVAGGRYIQIDIDRDKAARLGLNISDVQDVVRTAIGGMNVTDTVEGLERYPVNVRYPRDYRNSLASIRQLPVVTAGGGHVVLGDVANVRIEDGPPLIKSEAAQLTGWTYVDIAGRDVGSYVAAAQKLVAARVKLPAGYSLAWSGQYEYMQAARKSLTTIVPVTIMLISLLLYMAFRRVSQVLLILGTLPMALAGGAWLLYLLGYNLSVAVAVGLIALAGVTTEIGVVLVVYLNQSVDAYVQRCQSESSPLSYEGLRDAVRDGALLRLRPISMTATAIIVGLLPVMFGGGTGSEVMRRIAAPMVGGMISSLFLTMLVLPAVFLLWEWRQLRKQIVATH